MLDKSGDLGRFLSGADHGRVCLAVCFDGERGGGVRHAGVRPFLRLAAWARAGVDGSAGEARCGRAPIVSCAVVVREAPKPGAARWPPAAAL